ncbi:hypothetical protein ABZT26_25880 [Streptomyces sp. NPDC005395]|uniref:hypothetical protein n=1 Tax=Streptomyces sp. NPDC005395 TaxID=3157042 RepID=UPI0033B6795A
MSNEHERADQEQTPVVPGARGATGQPAPHVRTTAHHLDRTVAELTASVGEGREATVVLTVTLGDVTENDVSVPALAWSAKTAPSDSLSTVVDALARRADGDLTDLPGLYTAGSSKEGDSE